MKNAVRADRLRRVRDSYRTSRAARPFRPIMRFLWFDKFLLRSGCFFGILGMLIKNKQPEVV